MASSTVPPDVSASTDSIPLRARLGDPYRLAAYLQRPGALRSGHFRLLSGLHTDRFLAFSQIAEDPEAIEDLVASLFPTIAPWRPDGVFAPSTAGVTLASALAGRLGVPLQLASLDDDGRPVGIVGESEIAAKRLLLVNDVVTTGEGLAALAAIVRERGGEVAGSVWFATRSPDVDVADLTAAPVAYLADLQLDAVPEEDCPACRAGVEVEAALDLN